MGAKIGGSQYDYVWDLAVNLTDGIAAAGSYSGSMTHDGTTVTSTGGRDTFVWAFEPSVLKDTDGDSIVDVEDNYPTVSNPTQANTDGDDKGDACDSDDDNDGITDNFPDLCPRGGEFNWTSMQDTSNPSASTDWDNDGCKDDVEDPDDDNDQVLDVNDICPYTSYDPPRPTWILILRVTIEMETDVGIRTRILMMMPMDLTMLMTTVQQLRDFYSRNHRLS